MDKVEPVFMIAIPEYVERKLRRWSEEDYRSQYRPDGKVEIAVLETKEYTAEGAWAHTVPSAPQKYMNRLPLAFTDYRKVPELVKHEALHNIMGLAGYNEGFVTAYARNPSSDIEFYSRARLVRR